jgi:hypothetical protein
MSDAPLFPPTPRERIGALTAFVSEERKHRQHMAWRHPDRGDYWAQRIANCDEALAHLAALAEAVGA